MTEPTGRSRRVAVSHPRTRAARRSGGYVPRGELRAMTPIGALYLRSLIRSQLRLSFVVLAGLGLAIGLLPVLAVVSPKVVHVRVLGLPLPWLVLGVLVFPAMVGAAAWYVRAVERTEQQFIDLVEHE